MVDPLQLIDGQLQLHAKNSRKRQHPPRSPAQDWRSHRRILIGQLQLEIGPHPQR